MTLRIVINMKNPQLFPQNFTSHLTKLEVSKQTLSILNTVILKLKPLLCVLVGIYTFTSSYPGSFTASHSHAEQQVDCKTKNGAKVITWTGGCVNGLLNGDGELVYETIAEGKKEVWKLVGKFDGGGVLGLHFFYNYRYDPDLYYGALVFYSEKISLFTFRHKINDNIFLKKWGDTESNPIVFMTFDEAWAKAEAATEKSKYISIDPHLLKEYLAGRYKFTKADTQAVSSSPDLADNANAADDPQVFGGGSSPNATKTKKKKR